MALTLQQKIDEAEAALHALQTGTLARVIVDRNGERVEFSAANRSALISYLADLKRQLPSEVTTPTNGPLGFFF